MGDQSEPARPPPQAGACGVYLGHLPRMRHTRSNEAGSSQTRQRPSLLTPVKSGGSPIRWMAAASSSLCSGLPAGAEINIPVSGLNEFSVVTDIQPAFCDEPPHAERFPSESNTAPPAIALRENRRRVGWPTADSALADVVSETSLSPCLSSKLSKPTPKTVQSSLVPHKENANGGTEVANPKRKTLSL